MTRYDVAIIGGGPAGSAVGTLLKKYASNLNVLILERELFPRDHVGESLLPIVCRILSEMGCWEAVEEANFPVKVGATFRWGTSDDLWDFDFLSGKPYEDAPRPGLYSGQRISTAFQVDRAAFDKILLDHARSVGVEVREQTKVVRVQAKNDEVQGLVLEDGSTVRARYTIDASGHSGILRRALGVGIEEPSALRNIAIWAYWKNAEWAVNVGVSGTRIQIMSLGWGWLWFIPLGPDRTSIGLVTSADYYRECGRSFEQLYHDSVQAEPDIAQLVKVAECEGGIFTTKDWSFVAERFSGPNWFLVGEAAGFADPILSAGISIAMVGALELAVTIKELDLGRHDASWLRQEYARATSRRIRSHIHFADYWYTANAHFTDLVESTRKIAEESGLHMDGNTAWRWLGSGGFVAFGGAGIGGFNLASTDWLVNHLNKDAPSWNISKFNRFRLNLEGAKRVKFAIYNAGDVQSIDGLIRANRMLPVHGVYQFLLNTLERETTAEAISGAIATIGRPAEMLSAYQAWEALVNDEWLVATLDDRAPRLNVAQLRQCLVFHANVDNRLGRTS